MKTSAFKNLNRKDFFKLFLLALGTFVLNFIQIHFIPALDISPEIRTFLSTAVIYVSKNYLTNSDGELLTKEQ